MNKNFELQLRNHYAKDEYSGKWNTDVQGKPNEDQDTFWIPFQDFRNEFSKATICYYQDDY